MRKQGVILVIATLMAVILCGAASAADSSTTGGEGLSDVNGSDASPAEAIDPTIWVQVNYEYAQDDINPGITVKDSSNNSVVFDKTEYPNNHFKINFTSPGVANGTKFLLTVTAPGYITQTQKVDVNQAGTDPMFYGDVTFDMKATENYKLGREVTAQASQLLGLSGANASDILVITTAGITQRNGTTSEDCMEGILNGLNGKVSFGQGNLLTLRKTSVDPVDFAFIRKNGNALTAVFFLNGSTTPVYQGTISQDMTAAEWNNLIAKVGGENAFTYASLANAWKAGAPADLLREAAFHGHMCQGTISGYAMSQVLIQYYPPSTDTSNPGSPYDVSAYKTICVPGDSDDDAIMNFLNTTPGKGALAGYDTTDTGATDNMVAFVRWVEPVIRNTANGDGTWSYKIITPGTGTLIVMKFNREEMKQQYIALGNTLSNDLDSLKFNTWIIEKIKNKQYMDLVTFLNEYEGLTEEQYYNLVGSASGVKWPNSGNATNKNQLRMDKREARGLDLAYIESLGLPNAVRAVPVAAVANPVDMKQVGIDAANLAKQIFLSEKGINLEKDCRDLVVQTTASYVYLNGQLTDLAMDGVYEVLGSRLTRKTLLPMHVAPWKLLYFCFTLRGADGETMDSLYMTYDPDYNDPITGHFRVGNGSNGKAITNIGPGALNNDTQLNNLKNNVFKNGGFFGNIQSIANAWRVNPRYDQLITFLFHDHACPGVQPGFFLSDMVFENFQLSPDEEYFYMAASIYCKDDSLVYLMGVSPGMGSYMNQRLIDEETASDFLPGGTEEGILVIWDKKNNIGRAVVLNFKWPELDNTGLTTSEAQRENSIHYFVNAYNDLPYDRAITPYSQVVSDFRWITAEEFATIKKGGLASGSSLEYLKGLPADRTRDDLIKVPEGTETGGSTSQGTSNGSVLVTSTGTGGTGRFSTGSVGTTGAAVNAATETTTTEAGAQPSGDAGKSYEVTQAGTENNDNTPWGTYAIVGIVSVLALGAVGFFFKGSLFGR